MILYAYCTTTAAQRGCSLQRQWAKLDIQLPLSGPKVQPHPKAQSIVRVPRMQPNISAWVQEDWGGAGVIEDQDGAWRSEGVEERSAQKYVALPE